MKKITDTIGTYDIPENPYDLMNSNSIYLNLFHNKEQSNSNKWKVTLTTYDDHGSRETYTAGILNTFEPARWFRNIPQQYREFDFYQDFLKFRSELKGMSMEKKPSAGFFYSNTLGHDSPFNTAYAYMFKETDQLPMVGIRFWDFYWFGELGVNDYKKGNGPDYTVTITERPKKGMIDGWA
jgi:hypothetical protein